ncbi:MAG TPA: HAD-IA family hydrolase [Steroidobacteraceae bacterium]|nr:HAD-IA family hydrolase [Steroidobacteraceae bacterium]
MSARTKPIRVVLFDVGGVLVQLTGVATVLGWVADRWTPAQLWHRWLHSPAVRAFETGRTDADTFAADLVAELELGVAPALFLESFAGWPSGLYPGAHELVTRIPVHITRALLSNSNALHWNRVVEDFGLGTLFEHRFVSHLTGKIKPDPDAFEHVARSLGCDPASVFFLDDNLLNVEAARAVGMQGAVAAGVTGAEEALREAGILC